MGEHEAIRIYYRPLPKAVVPACAVIILLVAGLALAGWLWDMQTLQALVPGSRPMPYLTSLGFLFAGLGLLAVARGQRALPVLAGLVLALGGGYLLTEYSLWAGLGRIPLAQYLPLPEAITETSQQSAVISLGLCMTGVALLRLPFIVQHRTGVRELDMLTGFLFGVASAGIVAHQSAESPDGGWAQMFTMPASVAACFMLIALALHAASPHPGMRSYERSELRLPVIITVALTGIGLWAWSVLQLTGLTSVGASLLIVGLLVCIPLASQVLETWIRRMLVPEPVNTEGSFRALVESMAEGVLVCNRKGQLTLCNPAMRGFFGLPLAGPREQALGRVWDEPYRLYPPGGPRPLSWEEHPLNLALQGRLQPAHELLAGSEEGGWRNLQVSARPVLSPRGRLLGAILTAVDVTQQRRDEQALKRYAENMARTSRELEQVTYISAHHLQEPIREIASYAQMLEREFGRELGEPAGEYLRYLVSGAQRLKLQLEDLLMYLDLGSRQLALRPVAMAEVVADCLAQLGAAAQQAVVTQGALPTVMGDRQLLGVLLQHLFGNALKFNRSASPRIEISAVQAGPDWLFRVSDNGIGIAPQYSQRIFDIFQRLNGGDQFAGTGIGLALCRRILTLHGGEIWHEPGREGGAVFCFRLPLVPPAAHGLPPAHG